MKKINRVNQQPFQWVLKKVSLIIKDAFTISPTKEECAISFISIGFFYLVLGVLLLYFIKNIPLNSELNSWLRLQSPVFILVAVLLTSMGGAVWFVGRSALKYARWGLVAYILIFVISGLLISSKSEVELILGIILLIGAVLTGLSLNASVGRYAYESNLERGE